MALETVVTVKGTTTIPDALRRELGISMGTVISWSVRQGKLVGEKKPQALNAMQQHILKHAGSWKGSAISGKRLLQLMRGS
jgi:bifunctional DNA-binding transcriptional regulator/antitoxin component of YhaV-PrlF toxin-antitoxin module